MPPTRKRADVSGQQQEFARRAGLQSPEKRTVRKNLDFF